MRKKVRIFVGALIILVFILLMDIKFFSINRAIGHSWEPYGGDDYLKTELDVFSISSQSISADTLIINIDKKYLIKYCIFGRLWITDVKRTYTAKYVYTMSSKAW